MIGGIAMPGIGITAHILSRLNEPAYSPPPAPPPGPPAITGGSPPFPWLSLLPFPTSFQSIPDLVRWLLQNCGLSASQIISLLPFPIPGPTTTIMPATVPPATNPSGYTWILYNDGHTIVIVTSEALNDISRNAAQGIYVVSQKDY